jgi:hypothetical protein
VHESLLEAKLALAFQHIVQHGVGESLDNYGEVFEQREEDDAKKSLSQLSEGDSKILQQHLETLWKDFRQANETVIEAYRNWARDQNIRLVSDESASPFITAFLQRAWLYCSEGADALPPNSTLSSFTLRDGVVASKTQMVPLDGIFLKTEDIREAGTLFSETTEGVKIILSMELVLREFIESVEASTWTEAVDESTDVWKNTYQQMLMEYGFARDAGDIEEILQKVWMIDLLGQSLPKPDSDDESGSDDEDGDAAGKEAKPRRSTRNTSKKADGGGGASSKKSKTHLSEMKDNAARGFKTLESVARMASQLYLSVDSKQDILKHYLQAAGVLMPPQMRMNMTTTVAAAASGMTGRDDSVAVVDLAPALRGVETWMGELFRACAAEKRKDSERYSSLRNEYEVKPEDVLDRAKPLIVKRYAILWIKMRQKFEPGEDSDISKGRDEEAMETDAKKGRGNGRKRKKMKKMAASDDYDGPDECMPEEEPQVDDDDLEEDDWDYYLDYFNKDFENALKQFQGGKEGKSSLFNGRDSLAMKKVRFLKERLQCALKRDPDLDDLVDRCIRFADMRYQDLELYEDLDKCIAEMDSKSGRFENSLAAHVKYGQRKDAFVQRLNQFIEEMDARYYDSVFLVFLEFLFFSSLICTCNVFPGKGCMLSLPRPMTNRKKELRCTHTTLPQIGK